jgi:hypothetical protein
MSTRGATPSATYTSNGQTPAPMSAVRTEVVNLEDVLQQVHSSDDNLPVHVREYYPVLTTTYKELMTDNKKAIVQLHPTAFMRSATTRSDFQDIVKLPVWPRKSRVESMLVQEISVTGHCNQYGDIPVGVKYTNIKGNVYGPRGEADRYVDIMGPEANALFKVGDRVKHRPSLDGLNIVAANFSGVTEESLKREYIPCPGAEHQAQLIVDDRGKILRSLQGITENLSPTICAQYNFDPAKIPKLAGSVEEGRPDYLIFPKNFLDEAVTRILAAKESLQHMNPIVDGTEFYVTYLPVGLDSWQELNKHPIYKAWEKNGVLEQKLNAPITLCHPTQMITLPNDEQTQEALRSKVQNQD